MPQSSRDKLLSKVRALPQKPGVYLFKNKRGKVIYIGKSRSLRDRVYSYFHKPGGDTAPKIEALAAVIADLEFRTAASEFDALLLETDLIKQHQPRYNTQFKDAKNLPYIKFTNETYPRLSLVRKVMADGARYFGPYTSSRSVHKTMKFLEKTFQIRPCHYDLDRHKVKACVYYQMGQCPAPCEDFISAADYRKLVATAIAFMEGKYDGVLEDLEARMKAAADGHQFEIAAVFRDRRQALKHMAERQRVLSSYVASMDAIGLARHGQWFAVELYVLREGRVLAENIFFLEETLGKPLTDILSEFMKQYYRDAQSRPAEVLVPDLPADAGLLEQWIGARIRTTQSEGDRTTLAAASENARIKLEDYLGKKMGRIGIKERRELTELSRAMNLGYLPRRIEGYDISNIQGEDAVGAQVSFFCGRPDKDNYRHYKIRISGRPDDYAMMKEMLARRFRRIIEGEEEPDLILIDGGKGHLNVAIQTLNDFNLSIPVIALAKEEEQVFAPESAEPLPLRKHSPGLNLLMRVRDEAHRFATSFHRRLRSKSLLSP
ncbi:MAG: excinuclease ABC subunit UvrC [bacterium]